MKIVKVILASLLLSCLSQSVIAAEYNNIQADGSSLAFVFKQMNVPVEGKFQKFSAQIALDPVRPETGKVRIDIDANSIDVGNSDGNMEVKGKNWFDAKSFPTVQFVSSSIKALGGNRFEVAGKITIKGQTKDIKVPFTMKPKEATAQMEGVLVIKRLEWGIGKGIWSDTETVADEVEVRFRFLASAKKK